MPRTSRALRKRVEPARGSTERVLRWKLIAFVVLVMSLAGAGTAAAAPELSVSDRLQDRRYEIRRVTLDGRRVRYRAGRRTAASRCS